MAWLQTLSFVPLTAVAAVRRAERRTMARLHDAAANTAERAILLKRDGIIDRFVLERLMRAGALRRAADDRYYLDGLAYMRFRSRRRRRALVALALLLMGALAMYFRGDIDV